MAKRTKTSKVNRKLKAMSKALAKKAKPRQPVEWRCYDCKEPGPEGDFTRLGGHPRCPQCNSMEVGAVDEPRWEKVPGGLRKLKVDIEKPTFPEPERCVKCASTEPMSFHRVSDGHECEDRPAWICDACGYAHLDDPDAELPFPLQMTEGYTDKLTPEEQIETEEQIAFLIFDGVRQDDGRDVLEQRAGDLSRDILKMVLKKFRPDLLAGSKG